MIPLLDAHYLKHISYDDVRSIFIGKDDVDIPLLSLRVEHLHEVGKVLIEKYEGSFLNLLRKSKFDSIRIIKNLITDFSSFRDISSYYGEEVVFLKRAQICPSDLSYIMSAHNKPRLKNLDALTAFADYKLPQMLRHFRIMEYATKLGNRIDNLIGFLQIVTKKLK